MQPSGKQIEASVGKVLKKNTSYQFAKLLLLVEQDLLDKGYLEVTKQTIATHIHGLESDGFLNNMDKDADIVPSQQRIRLTPTGRVTTAPMHEKIGKYLLSNWIAIIALVISSLHLMYTVSNTSW